STTQVSASRPNQGAIIDTTTVKITLTYGVLYFGCTLEKLFGINLARDIAKSKRLVDIIKPFKPVKIPMVSATTKIAKPVTPNNPSMAAPVPHKCPSATSPSHGVAMAVEK